MEIRIETVMVGAAAVGVVLLGLYIAKKGVAGAAADVVGVAADAAGGIVQGIGEVIGIPRTDEQECEKALREGRMWDASFACPAGTFIGGAWERLWSSERGGGASGSW
jgi:hypothetical protein